MSRKIEMTINGKREVFLVGHSGMRGEVPDEETLCTTLRERLNLTGTKEACGQGACGCCTVLMNKEAVPSCQILTSNCEGADIVTIEGLQDPATGTLDPIQDMVVKEYAFQCGYCTPGIIMSAKALFMKKPNPTAEEIRDALSGNYCRCISHYTVLEALDKLAGNKSDQYEIVNEAGEEK